MKISSFQERETDKWYEVQKFTGDDLKNSEELCRHFSNYFKKYFPFIFYTEEEAKQEINKRSYKFFEILNSNTQLLVIRDTENGKIKGIIELENKEEKNGYLPTSLNWIILSEELRGKITTSSKKISEVIFDIIKKLVTSKPPLDTIPCIVLNVKDSNIPALNLYNRLGFEKQTNDNHNIFMFKDL